MSVPRKTAVGGGALLLLLLVIAVAIVLGGLFWGWLFMVIAGAAGWHIGFGTAFLFGIGIAAVIGAIKGN